MIRERMRAWLRARIEQEVRAHTDSLRPLPMEMNTLKRDADVVSARLDGLATLLAHPWVHKDMTVAQAWNLHPAIREVFARRNLPACPDCPVGEDETLEEAAVGHGFPLLEMIHEMERCLGREAHESSPVEDECQRSSF